MKPTKAQYAELLKEACVAMSNALTQVKDAANNWPERERHEPPEETMDRLTRAIQRIERIAGISA